MNNFMVHLSLNGPTPSTTLFTSYPLCGQWPGAASDGQTMPVKCTPGLSAARYVIIKTGSLNYINFCEVQVFDTSKFAMLSCNDVIV
jgi:hypothetical protein